MPSRLLRHLQQVGGDGAPACVRAASAYANAYAWKRHVLLGDAAAAVEVPPPFLPALVLAPLQELSTVAMQAEEGGEADDEARGDEADEAGDDADGVC